MINEESTYNKMSFIHDNDNEVYSEDVYYVIRIGQEIEELREMDTFRWNNYAKIVCDPSETGLFWEK